MNEIRLRELKDGPFDVDNKIAGIVPMATSAEQEALTKDIDRNGQLEPIVLWKGKVVDGRCRQKAITTLGNRDIKYKELDDNLSEEDVRIFVKSINTRRNLTRPQKIMVACKESMEDNSSSIKNIAKSWGIGELTLKNARYIAKTRPEFVEPLFNGESVPIVDKHGQEVSSNKITAIYAYLKRIEETLKQQTVEETHGWNEDSQIRTQEAKDWYYGIVSRNNVTNVEVRMALAEYANLKYDSVSSIG